MTRCLLRDGLPGPLGAVPSTVASSQLGAQGEGPLLGERSTSISPTRPGCLEDSGDTDLRWKRGETGETDFLKSGGETGEADLLWDGGEGEQEVDGSWRYSGAERPADRQTVGHF